MSVAGKGVGVEVAGGEDGSGLAPEKSLEAMLSHSPARSPSGNDIGCSHSPVTFLLLYLFNAF